jgi:FtsH-binding integral membrane protein
MAPSLRVGFIVLRCLAAALAFYATAKHPYSFYILTRWVVFFTCCWGLYLGSSRFWPSFAPAYIAVGLTFNPILPFHFQRSIWHNLDIAGGAILLFSLAFTPTSRDSNHNT